MRARLASVRISPPGGGFQGTVRLRTRTIRGCRNRTAVAKLGRRAGCEWRARPTGSCLASAAEYSVRGDRRAQIAANPHALTDMLAERRRRARNHVPPTIVAHEGEPIPVR